MKLRLLTAASGLALILGSVPLGMAARGEEAILGGFTTLARATGLTWIYDQPSAPVPASPTGEFHAPYSIATTSSGPTGHAIASVAWPGDPAANVPKYAASLIFPEFTSRGFPPQYVPDVPNYPVRAETFSPQGPFEARSSAGPVGQMESRAKDLASDATTITMGIELPAVMSSDSLRTFASSRVEGGLAIGEAVSTMKGVRLLNGLITIESLVTRAKATSDGTVGKVSGRTTVTGLRINGQEMVIDDAGFRAPGGSGPGSTAANQLSQQALGQAGVTLLLAGPSDVVEGNSASRSIGGLLIGLDSNRFTPYANQMPEPLRSAIKGGVVLDKSMFFILGGATVRAAASNEPEGLGDFDFGADSFTAPDAAFTPATASAQVLGEQLSSPGTLTAAPASPKRGGVPQSLARTSAVPEGFPGLPMALVGLGLILAAIAAGALGRAGNALLAGRIAGPVCPLEEEPSDRS